MYVLDGAVVEADGKKPVGRAGHDDASGAASDAPSPDRPHGSDKHDPIAGVVLRGLVKGRCRHLSTLVQEHRSFNDRRCAGWDRFRICRVRGWAPGLGQRLPVGPGGE
jgi:hypothetical protein